MLQRIITGVLGIIPVILILISNEIVVHIAVALISLYALHEMYSAVGINKKVPVYVLSILFSAIFLALGFDFDYIAPLLFLCVVVLLICVVFNHQNIKITDISTAFFMIFYIVFAMTHIIMVRKAPFGNINIILIFLGAFATDTFAYFVGVTMGKHKLCPEISPKKTIEGAVGGVLGAVICFLIMGYIVDVYIDLHVNYLYMIILSLLCAILSELGDLAASIIKRQYGIKDFGNILPGHGGIMDRLDSIIFIAPLIYYFIKYFPVIG